MNHIILVKEELAMNKKEKNATRTSKVLILVIVFLVGTALWFAIYNPEKEVDPNLFTEQIKDQISLELRNNRHEVSDRIEADNMTEKDILEKNYLIRVNHAEDVTLLIRLDTVSAPDGIDEALKVRIYSGDDEKLLADDYLKKINGKVFKEHQKGNASKKNDTKYKVEMYFDSAVGNRYVTSDVKADITWFVSEEDAEKLHTSKTGDVKVIAYAFIVGFLLIIVLMVVFRNRINPEVFEAPDKDDKKAYLKEDKED